MTEKSYCTTAEAAKLLGTSIRTAQLWVESGQLEAWKTEGGHRRIARSSVERLLSREPVPGASRGAARAMAPAAGSKFRILVVDDDTKILRLFERQIAAWELDVEVATASDGYEALVMLGSNRPDLLIADLHMPHVNGFKMLQTILTIPQLSEMPVLVVSGLSPAQIRAEGNLPAAVPVLPKPVQFDEVRSYVEPLLLRWRSPSQDGASVLIVDDDPALRKLIRSSVGPDYKVAECADGMTAMRMINQQAPDVVLLDVMLEHEPSGLQVLEMIRAQPTTKDLPVILLSGLLRPADRQAGLMRGASAYVTKPFSPLELHQTLRKLLA